MKVATAFLTAFTAQAAMLKTPTQSIPSFNLDEPIRSLHSRQLETEDHAPTKRQSSFPEIKPAKVEYTNPISKREGVKRVRLYYGPFTLLPANAKRTHDPQAYDPNSDTWYRTAVGIPTDAVVLFANTTLQYEDGKVADLSSGVYKHHVTFRTAVKKVPMFATCPGQSASSDNLPPTILIGLSEEKGDSAFSTPDGMFNSGYYLSKSETFRMTGEIINYTNDTKVVYSVSELEYIPGRPAGSLDVVTQVLSVNQCESSDVKLRPPGGQKIFSFKSKELTVIQDGYILARRGHMHDGGVNVDLKINGITICDSKAIYGGEKGTFKTDEGQVWETVSATSECSDPVKVSKGDVVTLQTNYDLEKHPARQHTGGHGMAEEMGIMSFSFAFSS